MYAELADGPCDHRHLHRGSLVDFAPVFRPRLEGYCGVAANYEEVFNEWRHRHYVARYLTAKGIA